MAHPLLPTIEAFYDAVPRSAARAEDLSPFTLFVNDGPGWPYYARPRLNAATFTAGDVARVRTRQRELGIPESFEWVAETTPGLRAAAESAGLAVHQHPLMALVDAEPAGPRLPAGIDVRLVTPDDDLALFGAVAAVGFGSPGTATGPEGIERLAAIAAERTPDQLAFERKRLDAGVVVQVVALADGAPVGIGSHLRVGDVSEVAGIATLPAYRRRGIGAAITRRLVEDARDRGVTTTFLSAAGDAVARIYEQIGFRRIATACIAEPAEAAPHG